MAITYKVIQRKSKVMGDAPMQVATQVSRGRAPIRDIAEHLEKITSLGRGDVMNVLTHLGEVVADYIKMGYSVQLHELGTFTPRISSKAIPVGEDFGTQHIRGVNMRFTPSVYIKEELRRARYECKLDVCSAPEPSAPAGGGEQETGGGGGTPPEGVI